MPRIDDASFSLPLTDSARYLLAHRYLARLPDGRRETPEELFRRVARHLAGVERRFDPRCGDAQVARHAEAFFRAMTDFRFLPNAPTLLAAGQPLGQLFACFVLPVPDSVAGIFDAVRMAACVHSKGGGTGFDFSAVRQRGAAIGTGGIATGPVSFLDVFDAETETIRAGGTGWGANMGVLRCDHPDVLEFVRAKARGNRLRNFNLSVALTDEFFAHLRAGTPIALREPHTGKPVGELAASALLAELAAAAWRCGDPGALFIDEINRDNPTPALGPIAATNPCGEAPLLPFEACCLGGLNVAAFVRDPDGDVDWDGIADTARTALRMIDNAIEASAYPLPEIGEAVRRTRKAGIGLMGLAQLLLRLEVPYDSPDAERLAERLMQTVHEATREASRDLAAQRGSFPAFAVSAFAARGEPPMRNATTTSNAPNSTIGAIAGCTPGIEPLFALSFEKRLENGARLREFSPEFVRAARRHGFLSEQLLRAAAATASVDELPGVPASVRRVFRTALDIAPDWHLRIQAACQRHTDLGVSKTINLPRGATARDVERLIVSAHELGCKGVTCFRDGSLDEPFLLRAQAADEVAEPCPQCA